MKEIKITRNRVALVDDEDYGYLNQHKWTAQRNRNGGVYYAVRRIGNKHISMHRVIMKITDPKIFVDHIDHEGLNNRKYNLRLCSNSDNKKNVRSRIGSTSKYLGVNWHKPLNKWRAGIKFNGKNIHLGYSHDEKEAALLYNKFAKKYHGEFANLNSI